ncbi:MAG: hypothetical protein P8L89_08365, partial [Polaribacter sp.]|nr:hypothetical protein [Polaribacter sp.]
MRKLLLISMLLSLIFASACINEIKDMKSTDAKYPVADRQPEKLEKHGDVRMDNYFWMRLTDAQKNATEKDQQTRKVVDYLEAENTYYNKVTDYTKDFQKDLFEEMKGRI